MMPSHAHTLFHVLWLLWSRLMGLVTTCCDATIHVRAMRVGAQHATRDTPNATTEFRSAAPLLRTRESLQLVHRQIDFRSPQLESEETPVVTCGAQEGALRRRQHP